MATFLLNVGLLEILNFAARGFMNEIPEVEDGVRRTLRIPWNEGLEFDGDSACREQNTRWREFSDIAAIAPSRSVDEADHRKAMTMVAKFGRVVLEPLWPLLAEMPALAQSKWGIWRKMQRLEHSIPASFY